MVNLLPLHEQHKRRIDLMNHYTLVGGIIVVVGTVVLAGTLLLLDGVYRLNLGELNNQLASAKAQSALYAVTERDAQKLEKDLTTAVKAQGETTHWAALLTELQTVTPATISIEGVSFKQPAGASTQNRTEVKGKADSRRSLGEFQKSLSNSKYFKNVEIETSTLSNESVVTFRMTMDVDYDKLKGPA